MSSPELHQPDAERSVIDRLGRAWRVREYTAKWLRAPHADPHLRFESGLIVREVWTVPADWRSLSDRDLLALMSP